MRKILKYVCYVFAFSFLGLGLIMSQFQSNAIQQLPYCITLFAVFIRCAIILGRPKDGIAFWKRFLIGVSKTLLCLILAVLLSALFPNFEQTAAGWLFGFFMVLSICFLQSSRVLGWFKKNSVNEVELPISQTPEDIENSVVEYLKESDIFDSSQKESRCPNSKIISIFKIKNVVLWITSMVCCIITIPFVFLEINSWYVVFAILTLGIFIWAFLYEIKQVTKCVKNKRSVTSFQYMACSLFVEYTIHLIVVLFNLPLDHYDFENLSIFLYIFFGYLCLFRIPIMTYTYKQIFKEDDMFYLLPQWLIKLVNSYAESEAPMRAMLAFIIYPLFYLCTVPGGVFFLGYVIPAIIIYTIVFFILWVIRGATKKNSESLNDLVK